VPVRAALSEARARAGWAAVGPYAVLALALAFLGWFALADLSRPGLQYDETLFTNAALGAHFPDQSFVYSRFLGVPTMLMPYIGALKAWLYAPVFGVLGVSPASIRVPTVIATAATVCLAFALARRLFGAWIAALVALLMATDPAYAAMARLDYGPVAIAGLLRVGALLAYFGWLRTGSPRYSWSLAAVLILGVFNKLDFALFAVPLAVTAALVHRRRIVELVRERPVAGAVPASALAIAAAVAYARIYVPSHGLDVTRSHTGFPGRLSETWELIRTSFDGSGVYGLLTGQSLPHPTGFAALAIVALALAIGWLAWSRLRRPGERGADRSDPASEGPGVLAFFLLITLLSAAALAVTPQAVGAHHGLLLWPLPVLLAASALAAVTSSVADPRAARAAAAVLTAGFLLVAATQVRAATEFRSAFEGGDSWTTPWTTEIYPLERAVARTAPGADAVVVADWGIGNQLMALGDDGLRRRLVDAWPIFADTVAGFDGGGLFDGRRVIVVLHRPSSEIMPGTDRRVAAALRRVAPGRRAEPVYRGRVLEAYVVDDRPTGGSGVARASESGGPASPTN
jgi:4-amino-4-deoxy-L-arabinose transferase-like glycosyltransferase